MQIITSTANQAVKDLVKLRKTAKRKEKDLVLVDGQREVVVAIGAGWVVERLFVCEKILKKTKNFQVYLKDNEVKLTLVSEEVFQKISLKEKPDGVLATFFPKHQDISSLVLPERPLVIILESVEKPGNIGAIIRTAAAAGVHLIIINSNQTDIYNPNTIRSSEGEVFTQKIVKMSAQDTVLWLKKNKIKPFGAIVDGAKDYTKTDLSGPVALVLGSEASGLSTFWRNEVKEKIRIPMAGKIDSLNVSVAAAVIAFESLRQRREKRDN